MSAATLRYCVQLGDIRGYGDRYGLGPDRQRHVLRGGFGGVEDDPVLLIRLEALRFDGQAIGGRRKLIERVPAVRRPW
jgi:hypothetical protein